MGVILFVFKSPLRELHMPERLCQLYDVRKERLRNILGNVPLQLEDHFAVAQQESVERSRSNGSMKGCFQLGSIYG